MLYAGSAYAATVDPDLTTVTIDPAMLAAESAPLAAGFSITPPTVVATFSTGTRPYSDDSIWNTHVNNSFYKASLNLLHPQSDKIITFMAETTAYTNANAAPTTEEELAASTEACKKNTSNAKIRFSNTYISPVHLVNSTNPNIMAYVKGEPDSKSPIYNQWDANPRDFWLDSGPTTPLYQSVNGVKKKL